MEAIVIKELEAAIKVAYSGKQLGNTHQRYGNNGKANFDSFLARFPDKKVYNMPAVGGASIIEVDDKPPARVYAGEYDALVTKNPAALLTLRAADCIPLVFFSPGEQILALAHVGTSGAASHLPRQVVKFLKIDPANLHVYFGPAIAKGSYKFPRQDFDKQLNASWDSYIASDDHFVYLDLIGYVTNELKAAGVKSQNITVEKVDTGANPNYFSHRRHKLVGEPDGRNAFAVCLV